MTAKRRKRHYRDIAALVGGTRVTINGRGQTDVPTDNLSIQVKTR